MNNAINVSFLFNGNIRLPNPYISKGHALNLEFSSFQIINC